MLPSKQKEDERKSSFYNEDKANWYHQILDVIKNQTIRESLGWGQAVA